MVQELLEKREINYKRSLTMSIDLGDVLLFARGR